jgi:hypothetical protein
MKKIILTAAAVFAFSFANAQEAKSMGFAKGDFVATGSITTLSNDRFDNEGNMFAGSTTTFAPSVGYFVSDKISLSAGFASISDDNDGEKVTTSVFSLGAAYNFNAANQFSSRIGAGVGFGNTSDGDIDVKSTTFRLGYGISYFVSNHFALSADLSAFEYTSAKADVEGAEAATSTSFGVNLSNITLGLAYKF